MDHRSPPGRPWWKLYLTTWMAGGVVLLCILFQNFGAFLDPEDRLEVDTDEWVFGGWPIVFGVFDEPTFYAVAPSSYSPPAATMSPLTPRGIRSIPRLIFDILFACLVVGSVVLAAQAARARYPDLFRITILQGLALTALAALFLVALDRESTGPQLLGASAAPPLERLFNILHQSCRLFVYGALVLSCFFLSKPRWWRHRDGGETKDASPGDLGASAMNEEQRPRSNDPDIQGSYDALLRAGQRARELARATGVPLVFWRDGHVVYEHVPRDEPGTQNGPEKP